MKEKEFLEKLEEKGFTNEEGEEFVCSKIYYSLDDEENVILDEEGMTEEFEMKIKEINEILN